MPWMLKIKRGGKILKCSSGNGKTKHTLIGTLAAQIFCHLSPSIHKPKISFFSVEHFMPNNGGHFSWPSIWSSFVEWMIQYPGIWPQLFCLHKTWLQLAKILDHIMIFTHFMCPDPVWPFWDKRYLHNSVRQSGFQYFSTGWSNNVLFWSMWTVNHDFGLLFPMKRR